MHKRTQHRQAGLTLIEIMVALVILSMGLLGVAILNGRGLASTNDAYLYSQASALAYDMAERIRANAATAKSGGYNFTMTGTLTNQACGSGATCSATQLASYDKYEWRESLVKGLLPDASASISYSSPTVTIVLRWKGKDAGNCTSTGSFSGTAAQLVYTCFKLTLEP